MANYNAVARTNYFRVVDEASYNRLAERLVSETGVEDFSFADNGVVYHGFGSYSSVEFLQGPDKDGEEWSDTIWEFAGELQKILPDGEAFIYQETGHENLRYVTGFSVIATKEDIQSVDLSNASVNLARTMLGKPDWKTKMEY